MQQFKVSSYVFISTIEALEYEEIPEQYLNGYFRLFDENRDSEYLINESIKYFIERFEPAKTYDEALQSIGAELGTLTEEMKAACETFFAFLCKRKILVSVDTLQPLVQKKSLYKPGDYIGNWAVKSVLSERDHADIYLVTGHDDGAEKVIKLVNRNKYRSDKAFDEDVAEFKREYEILQRLSHVNAVCRTYGFSHDATGNPYIALEYIQGQSLSKYARENAFGSFSSRLILIEKILSGFSLIHESKIIHGDIHPSNILVDDSGEIKIIDLGLSKDIEVDNSELLKHGGVNFYMPPERINIATTQKFIKEPDLYSDVYQVGLLLYYIVYAKTPFKGFTWEELATNIKHQQVVFDELTADLMPVPQTIKRIIEHCLMKDPAARYKDAMAIFSDYNQSIKMVEPVMAI